MKVSSFISVNAARRPDTYRIITLIIAHFHARHRESVLPNLFTSEKKPARKQYYLLTIDEGSDAQESGLHCEKEAQAADNESELQTQVVSLHVCCTESLRIPTDRPHPSLLIHGMVLYSYILCFFSLSKKCSNIRPSQEVNMNTCTPMFTTALFTIARTWRQPNCPSTEEWIKKWYIYTMEYYSAIKRDEIMHFAEVWMDLETLMQSEVSQREKNKYCIILLACGI